MNVVFIVLDSFRQDHVSLYHRGVAPFSGVDACNTPNIDEFARESVVFENAYPEALPTIPIRCQLMTGQRTLHNRGWQPLTPEDVHVAQILSGEDYVCGLVTDTYHYRAPGMNYHRNFASYDWIRGQEYDPWISAPTRRNIEDYVNGNYPDTWRRRISQFLANTDGFHSAEDEFAWKVVDSAVDWLDANRSHGNVMLWVDSFDPHEPWNPVPEFDTYTDPAYRGPRLIMPMGGPSEDWASSDEVSQIQGLYAGECAFVDHCLGRLFEALRNLGYYDDSVIFLLADHGHPLNDHGKFLKGADRMYSELLKVPFMVRLPGGRHGGRRTSAIVQYQDVLPTLLDALGLPGNNDAMAGRSFMPVLTGDADEHRRAMITGYHGGIDRCTRDETWSYIQRPAGEPDELYHLPDDPKEEDNLIDDHPNEALRLAGAFGKAFKRTSSNVVKGVQGEYEMASSSIE